MRVLYVVQIVKDKVVSLILEGAEGEVRHKAVFSREKKKTFKDAESVSWMAAPSPRNNIYLTGIFLYLISESMFRTNT